MEKHHYLQLISQKWIIKKKNRVHPSPSAEVRWRHNRKQAFIRRSGPIAAHVGLCTSEGDQLAVPAAHITSTRPLTHESRADI